jgi:hypothetical protein
MVENSRREDVTSIRFWSFKSACPFLLLALVGGATLVLRHGWISYIAVFILIYSLHAVYCLMTGVLVAGAEISFPRVIVRFLPLLVLGRMTRAIGALDEITYIGQSFGSEWVILRFVDGNFPSSFVSRKSRRRFFNVIQAKKPSIKIYRACKT